MILESVFFCICDAECKNSFITQEQPIQLVLGRCRYYIKKKNNFFDSQHSGFENGKI